MSDLSKEEVVMAQITEGMKELFDTSPSDGNKGKVHVPKSVLQLAESTKGNS